MVGVQEELYDGSFPRLAGVEIAKDLKGAYTDIDYAFFIGAKPRLPGMERGDLLKDNGQIFVTVGKAMNDYASRDCKSIVVGNPANTNCLITAHYAKDIPKENFTAMTRLDHNRAQIQLALKTGTKTTDIKQIAIWGNHSPTMYPDIRNTTIDGLTALSMLDHEWIDKEFTPRVQQRGGEILKLRGASSVASAVNASIIHMKDWVKGSDLW